jgi:hypothetical protein
VPPKALQNLIRLAPDYNTARVKKGIRGPEQLVKRFLITWIGPLLVVILAMSQEIRREIQTPPTYDSLHVALTALRFFYFPLTV